MVAHLGEVGVVEVAHLGEAVGVVVVARLGCLEDVFSAVVVAAVVLRSFV